MSAVKPMKAMELGWMQQNAPYMPVVSAGLLGLLEDAGVPATLVWRENDSPSLPPLLTLHVDLNLDEVAQRIIDAPWPDPETWDERLAAGQAIKPILGAAEDPVDEWWDLAQLNGFPHSVNGIDGGGDAGSVKFVRSLLTEAVVDKDGIPIRNRLLRGVKADLSGVRDRGDIKISAEAIAHEISDGPSLARGSTGRGLGLVPNIQTFGATTGREPSGVGGFSPLLYILCWHGIMEMPPICVMHRSMRKVGGPLFSSPDTLSWPVWSFSVDRRSIRALFGLAAIHADWPDLTLLRSRGVSAVFRSQARPINNMIDAFGWGRRVA